MMKRLPFLALWVMLLLPALSWAQENRITGRVVDAKTKDPVPFASIGLREEGTGALTNEYGYFQLAGLEKTSQDSLIVMTLGYERSAIFIKRGSTEDLIVELKKRVIELTGGKGVVTVKGRQAQKPGTGLQIEQPRRGHDSGPTRQHNMLFL